MKGVIIMNDDLNDKLKKINCQIHELIDVVNMFSKSLTNINNEIIGEEKSNETNNKTGNNTISNPKFPLQPTLSNYEKQKRSNFIKEQIKLTAIKGEVTEENIEDFVFISYKSGDWEEIYKKYIAPLHKKYGLNIYCDAAFDDGNENWTVQMEKHITSKKCKAILCFLSKSYLGSYATLLEVMSNRFYETFAVNETFKPIIPIILDDNKQWDEALRENKKLACIPNSGPEYNMFINLLKNYLIVLEYGEHNIDSMTKEFLKKTIGEMIVDTNLNSHLTQSRTYEFILNTINLTNASEFNFYNDDNPEDFFKELVKIIEKSVKSDSPKIFSGNKNQNFSVTTFTNNKKEDFYFEKNYKYLYSNEIRNINYENHPFFFNDNNDYNDYMNHAINLKWATLGDFDPSYPLDRKNIFNFEGSNYSLKAMSLILDYYVNNDDKVTIPNNKFISKIGEGAFEGKLIKEIFFDENCMVYRIEDDAFNNCNYLEKINFPEYLNFIGDTAFENCTSLKNIVLPEKIKLLGEGAFSGCTSLVSIYIPNSMKEIQPNAFAGCTKLSKVEGINLDYFTKEDLEPAFADTPWFKNKFGE